jgi:chromosome segregation ATPase
MKKREEERSYSLHFFIAVLLLLITAIWLIWWETKTLRPWKDYQNKYYKLVVTQLEKELEQRVSEFSNDNVQKEYNDLKSALEKAKAEFESPAVQTEYKKISSELNEVSDELKMARLDFQKLRAEYLKVEYDYIKHGIAKDKQTLEGFNEEIAILDKKIKQLESEKREKRAKLNENTAPVI